MPRSSDARQRFIETAALLFQQRGYSAVGLNELIEKSQAPKGSFYHHFPGGKEELAKVALTFSGDYVARKTTGWIGDAKTLNEAACALLDGVADWFEGSGWTQGCPITTVALEVTPENPELHATVEEIFESWIEEISAHAQRLHAEHPRDWAECLLTQIQGAWIVGRIQKSRAPFNQIKTLYRD
ncbi:MAG: TetR/AcrR family transcriptional regulator [Pseudomonadota bacterium]